MEPTPFNLIVVPGAGGNGSSIHHHDFPEVRGEGVTPHEAAEQLLNHLTRSMDSALLEWRREAIEKALNDVRAFLGAAKA
jgi:hypothetical protein